MRKVFLFIVLTIGLLATTSCGDANDTSLMYNWKNVWYAFELVEEPTSLKGLEVEINYVDPSAIERGYTYSGFEQWNKVYEHLPWGFIPRMKATIVQPEGVEYSESDFPAVIHIRMGITDGDNLPLVLDKKEEFATYDKFNDYIGDKEKKTYIVYPTTTGVE
jgi:hypothetical protein